MRRRFALTILAVTTMVTLSFSIPFAAVIKTVAADQALIAADHESQSLAGVLGATASPSELTAFIAQLNAGNTEQATVIFPGGARIGAALSLPPDDLALARTGRAFTTSWAGATHVLVPVRGSSGAITIGIVTVPGSLLRHGVAFAWLILALVSLFIIGLGVVLADRLGRSLVASVRNLGGVTRRLQRGELDARVTLDGPSEIQEVGETLNTLAGRIVEMLEQEREAAADLSHRLRTPLMALQLDAETIKDPGDRAKVNDGIGRLTEAVTAVIRAARRDDVTGASTDLSAVTRERLAFWSVLADEQGRQWTSTLTADPIIVAVGHDELVAAIDVLLANVFVHTNDGVDFAVRTEIGPDGPELIVEDAGAGFVDGHLPVRGKSGGNSTGLGLDIATQTARSAGGEVVFGRSPLGGASVRVRFESHS